MAKPPPRCVRGGGEGAAYRAGKGPGRRRALAGRTRAAHAANTLALAY